jgi:phosphatidylglycerophosphate synthase
MNEIRQSDKPESNTWFAQFRGFFSRINNKILSIGGYADKFNPNQTTLLTLPPAMLGMMLYLYGLYTGNHTVAYLGVSLAVIADYGDAVDGDHAKKLIKDGKWKTNTGKVFDPDVDKIRMISRLAVLGLTNTLTKTENIALWVNVAIAATLDLYSSSLRKDQRDIPRIIESLKSDANWQDTSYNEASEDTKNGPWANVAGKIKTIAQAIWALLLQLGIIPTTPQGLKLQVAGVAFLTIANVSSIISLGIKHKRKWK